VPRGQENGKKNGLRAHPDPGWPIAVSSRGTSPILSQPQSIQSQAHGNRAQRHVPVAAHSLRSGRSPTSGSRSERGVRPGTFRRVRTSRCDPGGHRQGRVLPDVDQSVTRLHEWPGIGYRGKAGVPVTHRIRHFPSHHNSHLGLLKPAVVPEMAHHRSSDCGTHRTLHWMTYARGDARRETGSTSGRTVQPTQHRSTSR